MNYNFWKIAAFEKCIEKDNSMKVFKVLFLFIMIQSFYNLICFSSFVEAESDNITKVDLTGITEGGIANHTHVYEQKFDNTAHWTECFVCGERLNYKTHTIVKSGYEGCDPDAIMGYEKCADECGYLKDFERQQCVINKKIAATDGNAGLVHLYTCSNCGKKWGKGTTLSHEYNGKDVYELGHVKFKCDVCGLTIDNTKHWTMGVEEQCRICGKYPNLKLESFTEIDDFDFTDSNGEWKRFKFDVSHNTDYKSVYINEFDLYYAAGKISDCEIEHSITKQTSTGFTVEGRIRLINEKTFDADELHLRMYGRYTNANTKNKFTIMRYYFKPDRTAPEILSVNVEEGEGWSESKTISVTVKETYSTQVNISLYEGDTEIPGSLGLAVNNGNGTWTRTFDSVGEIKGTKTIKIKASDRTLNTSYQEFEISNIDNQPPVLLSKKDYLEPWRIEETIKFEVSEQGIGQVSIAFNDRSDYQLATYNPETGNYERSYCFTGDVGVVLTGVLYMKDGMGNESMERINFNLLDKTADKPSKVEINGLEVNVSITDNLSNVYWNITKAEENEPSEWKDVNEDGSISIPKLNVGRYWLWLKDEAGNVSYTEFVVEPISIVPCEIGAISKMEYSGEKHTPSPVIVKDGETLIKGIDYTLSYANNTESGMATVIVTGIGNYKDTATKQFLIYIVETEIDVTDLKTVSSVGNHDCNNYAINKYDERNHWQECSVCSVEYINAGRPDGDSWENNYLEIVVNGEGERILVIKNSFKIHSYTENWSLGETCTLYNKLNHICTCGYNYQTENTRTHVLTTHVNNTNQYRYYQPCDICGNWMNSHKCINEKGEIHCGNLGTCTICNYNYTIKTHQKILWSEIGDLNCEFCGTYVGKIEDYKIEYLGNLRAKISIDILMNGIYTPYAYEAWPLTGTCELESTNHTLSENRVKVENIIKIEEGLSEKDSVQFSYDIAYTMSDGAKVIIGETLRFNAENEAPVIESVLQNSENITNYWKTTTKIKVTGTENYCSSVNISMKDMTSNEIIYSGKTLVDGGTKKFMLEFIPNIAADENGKEYEIIVEDALGNTTIQKITISKVDGISPVVQKEFQTDANDVWATPIQWSKEKEFVVKTTDEGSQIVRVKFQDVTNPETGYSYKDKYGISTRNEDANPIINTRKYQFVGDVNNYVTALIYLQDEAGNESTEYLRIYNLDNTAPEILIKNKDDNGKVSNANIQANLKDGGSGIRYFAITTSTQSSEPTNTENTDTTLGKELNKWYQVKNLAETTPNKTEANDVEIVFNKLKTGTYKLWAKDLVGNVSNVEFEVENRPLTLNISHEKDREWYEQDNKINIELSTEAEEYEIFDSTEQNQNLIARIVLKDSKGNVVDLSDNVKVMIDGTEINYTTENNQKSFIYVVESNLNENAFSKINNIQIDMTKLYLDEYLRVGKYSLEIEYYIGNVNELNRKVTTHEIEFRIHKYRAYSIVATILDENNKHGEEVLNIKPETTKEISLEYVGDLEEPYVIVTLAKVARTKANGTKEYTTLTNSVTTNKINPLSNSQSILATFGSNLEKGEYQLLFELYDKHINSKIRAKESLEFCIQ